MKINTLKNNNKNIDKRGYLFEFLKEKERQLSFNGQIYFATIRPGFSRGDHYHKHRSEIFSVISGKFEFIIHDLNVIDMQAVMKMQIQKPQLSDKDCSALYCAQKLNASLINDISLVAFVDLITGAIIPSKKFGN